MKAAIAIVIVAFMKIPKLLTLGISNYTITIIIR